MLIIRAYICLGELQVTVNTTVGVDLTARGKVIDPLLYSASHQIAEDHAPIDMVQALHQVVDDVEHYTQGHLYDHLAGVQPA